MKIDDNFTKRYFLKKETTHNNQPQEPENRITDLGFNTEVNENNEQTPNNNKSKQILTNV